MKFDIKMDSTKTQQWIKSVQRQLAKLPQEAFNYFKASTPIDKGNARRNTKLNGSTIEANYAYAERLDDGHSKQAPKGMVEPTERFIKKRVKEITGK